MWNSWGAESAAGHGLLLLLSSASSSSSSSHQHYHHQEGDWFEAGEEASLERRCGSGKERAGVEGMDIMMKENTGNMRKRKASKINFHGDEDGTGEKEEKDGNDDSDMVKKKAIGGGSISSTGGASAVMEGSRCSRVNGRGWRCCQQTLVGYALCEHHLGKGRLRSMISVRSRSSSALANTAAPPVDHEGSLSSLSCKQRREDSEEGSEEKLMMMKEKNKRRNKRKRIGTVKARSISSLLGQTHEATAAAATATTSTAAPTTAIALGGNLSSSSSKSLE